MTPKIHTKQLFAKNMMVLMLGNLLFPCLAYGAEKHDSCAQISRELAFREAGITKEMVNGFNSLQECSSEAMRLYLKAKNMKDLCEKTALLKKISEKTLWLTEKNNQTYFTEEENDIHRRINNDLYSQVPNLISLGTKQIDIADEIKDPTQQIESYNKCHNIFKDCMDISKSLHLMPQFDTHHNQVLVDQMARILLYLSLTRTSVVTTLSIKAKTFNSPLPNSVLDMLEEAIKYTTERYEIKSSPKDDSYDSKDKQSEFDLIHGIALESLWDIHTNQNAICDKIIENMHQKTPDLISLSAFDNSAQTNLKMINFISAYFINSYAVSYQSPCMQGTIQKYATGVKALSITDRSIKTSVRKQNITNSINVTTKIMHHTTLLPLVYVTYCKAVKGASFVMNSLATNCDHEFLKESYAKKSGKYLETSRKFYKEHVYQEEYKANPEKESLFILARLEDLIGNPAPLAEFYKTLHQERRNKNEQRIVKAIKAHQEEIRKTEEEKATQKAQQEEFLRLTRSQSNKNNAASSLPDLVHTEEEVFSSSISVHTPKDYVVTTPKKKIKTRPDTTEQSKIYVPTQKEKEQNEKEEPVHIHLDEEDYMVFQRLTGGSADRNVTLSQVEKLLTSTALNCTRKTGGNHPKMAAPNGSAWTIPPEWEGPISAYYRHQLNEFLQNTMGIDPETVHERQTLVRMGRKNEKK